MAAKIISDNKLDQEIARQKRAFDELSRTTQSFMSTYRQLPPKERARYFQQIQGALRQLQVFITKPQAHELTNAGTRFALDTLKASINSFSARWMKFERVLGELE